MLKTGTHPEIDRSKFKGNFTFLSTSAQKQSVCIYKFAKALDCTARAIGFTFSKIIKNSIEIVLYK
jgi:hypothetical protein